MNSTDFFRDGMPVGSDSIIDAPPVKKTSVAAGFGSPADDATVRRIDLNDALIDHHDATFVMRAAGHGMRDAGIESGDVLLVDRARKAVHGNIVVAAVDGDMMCRRLWDQEGQLKLQAAHPDYPDTQIKEGIDVDFWGVVTYIIKSAL